MKRAALIMATTLFIIFTIHFFCYANGNIIYGCYKKDSGQLRIVKHAGRCLPSEVPISWNQAGIQGPPGEPCNDCGDGSAITVRQMEPGPCTNGYGWCPDGLWKWDFYIQDSAVNESSVIAINIKNPRWEDYGCEVATKANGEFIIICVGADIVRPGTILQYAVFNP